MKIHTRNCSVHKYPSIYKGKGQESVTSYQVCSFPRSDLVVNVPPQPALGQALVTDNLSGMIIACWICIPGFSIWPHISDGMGLPVLAEVIKN
jgi:hypothetical protein